MQFRQTFKSAPQMHVSERPGEPDKVYSAPHFQQCRVRDMPVLYFPWRTLASRFSSHGRRRWLQLRQLIQAGFRLATQFQPIGISQSLRVKTVAVV